MERLRISFKLFYHFYLTAKRYGRVEFHLHIKKKVLTKLQKGIVMLQEFEKILIVCMTFKKSLKLKKNRFFRFFLYLNSTVKMPSCPTLWYDAQ